MYAYADVTYADDFLKKYAVDSHWSGLSTAAKEAHLFRATIAIDSLNSYRLGFLGKKLEANAENQFPRDIYDPTPENVKKACCLEAFSLSNQQEANRYEWQRQGVKSISIGKTAETYEKTGVNNGLISTEAFNLLVEYLNIRGVYPIM